MAKAKDPNKKTVRDYENAGYEGYTRNAGSIRDATRAIEDYHAHLPVGGRNSSARGVAETNVATNLGVATLSARRYRNDVLDGISAGDFTQEELNEALKNVNTEIGKKIWDRLKHELDDKGTIETQTIPSQDYSNKPIRNRIEQYQRDVAKRKSLVKMVVDQQKQIKSLVRKYNQLKSIIG